MSPCSSGSPAPQDSPVILRATPGAAMIAALPAHSHIHGTRALTQNEAQAREAAVTRLMAEAEQAASVAHDLESPELRSALLRLEKEPLKLENALAEERAWRLTKRQRCLRHDAEMAALDETNMTQQEKFAAQLGKVAPQTERIVAMDQEKAARADAREVHTDAEDATSEALRTKSSENVHQIVHKADNDTWVEHIRGWDELVESRTAEIEAAEAVEMPLLPQPLDGWMRPPPALAPAPSAAATLPAPAELHCEPTPWSTEQELRAFAVLQEEFPGLPLGQLNFICRLREGRSAWAPDE
ncbi:unnamed protein product, partial [Laminaria digitata]